ncbi:MAG: hypothetical protein Q9M28_11480 [Mariprofundaceae bacterium]|nr:hypothetical protein [Mariprofundaceae bacterium]
MLQRFLITLFLTVLYGCGSSGNITPTNNTNTVVSIISGTANLGVVNQATVNAHAFINGAASTVILGSSQTDAAGKFSIDIGTYTGLVMLILSNPNSTATYTDEAKGKNIPMGANSFRALLIAPLTSPVSITPLTEIITVATIRKIQAGIPDGLAMAESTSQVAAAFINNAHPLYTTPMDISIASAGTAASEAYASGLAGLAIVAAAGNKDIFTVARTYADILFPTGTSTGSFTVAQRNELASASLNFNGNALVLNTPNTIAVPTGSVDLGSITLGKTFFYLYQNIDTLIATVTTDVIETGVLSAAIPNSNLAPLELWHSQPTTSAIQQPIPAIDTTAGTNTTASGGLNILTTSTNTMALKSNNQARLLAGSVTKTGLGNHERAFAVRQNLLPLTPAMVSGTYHFISMGKNNTGSFTKEGSLSLSANFTLSLTENHTDLGVKTVTQTQAYVYSILIDNRINIAMPDGREITIMLADGLAYGLFSEVQPSTGAYSSGFIIRQHNNVPYLAGHNYHYSSLTAATTQLGSENGIAFLDGLGQFTGNGTQLITSTGAFSSFANTTFSGKIGTLAATQTSITFNQKVFPAFYSSNGEIIIAHDPGVAQIILIQQ